MPATSPEIGEVWSDSAREEGLVIARSTDAVRLISRSGRRMALPLRSMLLVWRFVQESPRSPLLCSQCDQEAYFFHTLDGSRTWVCDRHIPRGAGIQFHCDPETAQYQNQCPQCGGSVHLLDRRRVEEDTYVQQQCPGCRTTWFRIDTSGASATIVASHLLPLIDSMSLELEVEILAGHAAHRDLRRAVGSSPLDNYMGIRVVGTDIYGASFITILGRPPVRAISGIQESVPEMPLRPQLSHPRVASVWQLKEGVGELVVVQQSAGHHVEVEMGKSLFAFTLDQFYSSFIPATSLPDDVKEQLERQSDGVGLVTDDASPVEGTFWRRRRHDNQIMLCRVSGISPAPFGELVRYEVIYNPQELPVSLKGGTPDPMPVEQFLEHWTLVRTSEELHNPFGAQPQEGSFWVNVESQEVIRVAGPTVSSLANAEVRSYPARGSAITNTGVRSFTRLHYELPYPPGDTLWENKDGIYCVETWEGSDGYDSIQVVLRNLKGESSKVGLIDLYERFHPLAFESHAPSTPSKVLKFGAEWVKGEKKVVVFDIGTTRQGRTYVRFTGDIEGEPSYTTQGIELGVLSRNEFLNAFDCVVPPCPCQIDERWTTLDQSQDYYVTGIDSENLCVRLSSEPYPASSLGMWVSFEELLAVYTKVQVKTVWEALYDD